MVKLIVYNLFIYEGEYKWLDIELQKDWLINSLKID